jgi:flavin-dependent dehydrogenase
MRAVSIVGGGPAGTSAAIAALSEGSAVTLIEKSKFPRHKVCGEFLSPEIAESLDEIHALDAFRAARPARIRRLKLHFGRREKVCRLPEPAWGLSRFTFDALLLDQAQASGANIVREGATAPTIIASGRSSKESRGHRLFGFKAHFEGPFDDAVELFFFDGCYVGVNSIEDGKTNICGLAPENFLRRFDFDYDRVVAESPALSDRVRPLLRKMNWLTTGPLRFAQSFSSGAYLAGDALSFVDPFTGSGLVAAVKTGSLAGRAAARALPAEDYIKQCRASLRRPFEIAGIFRKAVNYGWAESLAGLVPGRMLFALTRPGK